MAMSRIFRLLPLLLLFVFCFGCADAAKHLRAQPAWFLEPSETLKVPLAQIDKTGNAIDLPPTEVEVKCVRTPRESGAPTESTTVPQCLYLSMDMNQVFK